MDAEKESKRKKSWQSGFHLKSLALDSRWLTAPHGLLRVCDLITSSWWDPRHTGLGSTYMAHCNVFTSLRVLSSIMMMPGEGAMVGPYQGVPPEEFCHATDPV